MASPISSTNFGGGNGERTNGSNRISVSAAKSKAHSKIYSKGQGELTSEQILVASGVDGQLMKRMPRDWYKKVREMRHDPTIGFGRDMYMAPIMAADWSVTTDDERYKNAERFIYDAIVPHRRVFLKNVIRGRLDFGWQAFEVVKKFTEDGYITVRRLKPLLQDLTDILVDVHGKLVGVRNMPFNVRVSADHQSARSWPWVDLLHGEYLVVSRDVEGTDWYGNATMRRVETPYESWNECEQAARRFDTKMAGAHWVVRYPIGTTMYKGVETDNYDIAQDILVALEASGRIAVPVNLSAFIGELNINENTMPWKIDLLAAPTTAEGAFVGRQRYQDSLKVRGLGIPERAVLEGQFGTRAEAEAHADFAISNIEMEHQEIVDSLNEQLVNDLLELNFGKRYRDRVRVQASPLSDDKKAFFRELYSQLYSADTDAENKNIDWDAVREYLNVPVKADTMFDDEEYDMSMNDDEEQMGLLDVEANDGLAATEVESGEQGAEQDSQQAASDSEPPLQDNQALQDMGLV